MKTFRDLIVWQKAIQFATEIYKTSSSFPVSEQYGLTSQLRRAIVSVSSNIAEGSKRGTKKDFTHFLRMAQGSCAEIETQITIANNLEYLSNEKYNALLNELQIIMKMLTRLINATKE